MQDMGLSRRSCGTRKMGPFSGGGGKVPVMKLITTNLNRGSEWLELKPGLPYTFKAYRETIWTSIILNFHVI